MKQDEWEADGLDELYKVAGIPPAEWTPTDPPRLEVPQTDDGVYPVEAY